MDGFGITHNMEDVDKEKCFIALVFDVCLYLKPLLVLHNIDKMAHNSIFQLKYEPLSFSSGGYVDNCTVVATLVSIALFHAKIGRI